MAFEKFSRRGFIGAAAATGMGVAATTALGPLSGTANAAMAVAAPDTPSNNLGLQLYSVRGAIASFGFAAVFEELARIGFKEVEFAGYTSPASPGITVKELRELLDKNGLKAAGTHANINNLLNPATRVAEFEAAQVLGMKHVGTGSGFAGNTVAEIKAEAARWNDSGKVASAMGLKLYSHNHDTEFAFTDDPTKRRLDVFLAETNPSFVFWELDILWAFAGARTFARPGGTRGVPLADGGYGFDPADYVVANPARFPLFHTKDGNPTPNPAPATGRSFDPAEFGAGTIPFRAFFDKIGARAYHHPLWEQDNAPNTPAALGGQMGAALRSFNAMHAMRTLTWIDELIDMVERYAGAGRISAAVAASLTDRATRARDEVEGGSEVRTRTYLAQFVARAQNQIKGGQDVIARALLVQAAQSVISWLDETEARENAL